MSVSEPDAIPAISAGALRSARRMVRRSGREALGQFLVEGPQAVREALRIDGGVVSVIVDDPARNSELVADALAAGVRVVRATTDELASLADTVTPQGIIAVCRTPETSLDDLPATPQLVVICAQVRDPGNAGTVIRCADAFGADGVVLTTGSVELTNPKTVRASVGSVFHLPIVTGVALDDAIAWAREHGLQTLAADAGGEGLDALAAQGELARPTAWVMGNEAWGFADQPIDGVDKVVSVPMWGQAESLNLSTAAAICLYTTAAAQRRL